MIYGSESGTAERGIRAIAKGWKESKGIEVSSIMEGADAARIGLASLAEQYDFLAVATSSNGEGDPPFNFHPFLKALYEADDAGDKPLTGAAAEPKVTVSLSAATRAARRRSRNKNPTHSPNDCSSATRSASRGSQLSCVA